MYDTNIVAQSESLVQFGAAQQTDNSHPDRRRMLDRLIASVYPDLLALASALFAREPPGHLLEPAALVNEAYMRLTSQQVVWRNRVHFFAITARLMRRILIDHARRGQAQKRVAILPPPEDCVAQPPETETLALHDALDELAVTAPRRCAVLRLRFFAGLTICETGLALNISPATVKLETRAARCWLFEQLAGAEGA